jgi:hypothetical protein
VTGGLDSTARDELLTAAARIWVDGCARMALLTPREAAREAYEPGGPSADELERRIRARRERQAEVG